MDARDRELVFHYILEDHAGRQPDKPFLVTRDRSLTYAETEEAANRIGRGFAALGVEKGDRVLVMMPTGIDFFLVWLGLCKIGALMSPMNEAYVKRMLQHQAFDAAAKVAVVADAYLPRWVEVADGLPELRRIVRYADGGAAVATSWEESAFGDLIVEDGSRMPPAVSRRDPMAIFYTSGTTGPSKGVLYSYAQGHATAREQARLCGRDDVFYMCVPMFHVGLCHLGGIPLIAGATLAIRQKFSATQFWDDIRHFGATMTLLMSTMPAYLMAQPETDHDPENPLAKCVMVPLLKELDRFKSRFGVPDVATVFNMTEVSTPICTGFDLPNATSCGRPRPGITARIVDDDDRPVATGEIGELILRSDEPWEFNLGYWRQPAKTVEAWRNQWLHTGDLFSADSDGNFYFRDRLKDAIRRRGENISSHEIEREVDAHPAILESAAIAVPSAFGEEEVKVVAALRPGQSLSAEEMAVHLAAALPAYMQPRYLEIRTEELPKTPTGKIQKPELRAEGIGAAWDRES